MWQVLCSSRPPTLLKRHMDLHVWSYSPHSDIFLASFKSFRAPGTTGGRILAIYIATRGFYNSLYDCTSRNKQLIFDDRRQVRAALVHMAARHIQQKTEQYITHSSAVKRIDRTVVRCKFMTKPL